MDNARLKRLEFWCQHVLPLVYDDSLSYYELLCKVVTYLNDLIDNQLVANEQIAENSRLIAELQKALAELKDYTDTGLNGLRDDINFLKNELEKIANGEYMDVYIEALAKWIDANLQQIVAKIAKQVFFQLEGDYFVVFIPESWSDITFDTIMLCGDPNWGHLVLKY